MHLGLRAPNIWFRARLRYPDTRAPGGRVDANGFTLPGLPALVVGSNGHVAWGFTNSYADTADWYPVKPCGTGDAAETCDAVEHHAGVLLLAALVEERDDVVNPLGAKGLGEIGLVGVAAAIANAVYNATGKRIRELPITLDKLL